MIRPAPDPIMPGQESVGDYRRPAIAQLVASHLRVTLGAHVIADTRRSVRTIETSHPPTYHFPLKDILPEAPRPAAERSFCEWKGSAIYFDVAAATIIRPRAAWSYPDPSAAFGIIRDHIAFYPAAMDACFVDDELVVPQAGGFYGGWITSAVAGPFKGRPGSQGW